MADDDLTIRPTPTDEEAAAIAAAVYIGWPPAVAPAEEPDRTDVRWRFGGRWWNRPIWGRPQANRQRP
ncbi:MAG: hypothetical protein AAGA93_03675 [Actinomycetota bacterium]